MKSFGPIAVTVLSLLGLSMTPVLAAATCAQRIDKVEARLATYGDSEKKTEVLEELNEAKTAHENKKERECNENIKKAESGLKKLKK